MLNFTFHNSTRIHFGSGQIARVKTEIPADARVLLAYGGGSIKNNGVYQQVVDALQQHTWFEFSGIEPNPSYDTLMQSMALIKEHKIDYILAVGGGSVADGCKFIAAAAVYEGSDPWDILAKGTDIEAALPLGVVLTLPATGSETNTNSVVSRDGNKLAFSHPLVRPEFAVLDPATTLSLSDRQLSNGVVDAFVHTMEQYLTYSVEAKVQDRFAEGLLLTLVEEGPKLLQLESKDDLQVRANVMWAATQALNGLIGAGVPQDWSTHMIGHELTAAHGIDHARTLSIVLPGVMRVQQGVKKHKILQYGARVWGIEQGSEQQRIEQTIERTEGFFQLMQLPIRLSEVNLDQSHISNLVDKLELHGMTKLGEHADIDLDTSRKILQSCL